MVYDPDKHHRRSIRLKGYDYSKAGAYFITICVNQQECLLGEIIERKMILNEAGIMIQNTWEELPIFYSGFDIDAFVVMPNHIHGIIILNANIGVSPCAYPLGQPQGVAPTGLSLPDIVHRFKTLTTKRYTDGVKTKNWKRFHKRFWQRNYYEHIIRNEFRLNTIRKYIANNPLKWEFDTINPNEIQIEEKKKFWKIFLEI